MSSASLECTYQDEATGICCRNTEVNTFVLRKKDDELYVRYYVACKDHYLLIKEKNENAGFSVFLYKYSNKDKFYDSFNETDLQEIDFSI